MKLSIKTTKKGGKKTNSTPKKRDAFLIVKDIVPLKSKKEETEMSRSLKKRLAKAFYKFLINNIKNNRYGFRLSPVTKYLRKKRGLDDLPLIANGDLIKSIYITKDTVSIRAGYHTSGLSYVELWRLLEFGKKDMGLPSFPIWSLSAKEFSKISNKLIKEENKRREIRKNATNKDSRSR